MNYKQFIKTHLKEDTLAFVYNDGGTDQTVIISGSKSQLKKVQNKLPSATKYVDNVPSDAWEISASEWLKIK